jgi:hypothetical protein
MISIPVSILALALTLLASTGIAMAEQAKTSKERLSDKASDDQRVDDCGVAPERRGTKARPDCPGKPAPAVKQGAPAPR